MGKRNIFIFLCMVSQLLFAGDATYCISKNHAVNSQNELLVELNELIEKCDDIYSISKKLDINSNELLRLSTPSSKNASHSFIKIFTKHSMDKWIDLYAACGGKKNNGKFLNNIILIEAYNACLYPTPNGVLSEKDTIKVANKIAGKYKDYSLVKLAKFSGNILNDSYESFITSVLKNTFKDQIKANTIDAYLSESKHLKTLTNLDKTNSSYREKLLVQDIMIESFEKLGPLAIKDQIISALPKQYQTEKYYAKNIQPNVDKSVADCLAPSKKQVLYNDASFDKRILNIDKIDRLFCESNPKQCNKNIRCKKSANYISPSISLSDTDYLIGCALKAANDQLKTVIGLSLKEEFSKNELINKSLPALINHASVMMNGCMKDHLAVTDFEATSLGSRSIEEYTKALDECQNILTWHIGEDVLSAELGTMNLTSEIQTNVSNVFKKCKSNEKVTGPNDCISVIEMHVGVPLVVGELEKLTESKHEDLTLRIESCRDEYTKKHDNNPQSDIPFYKECITPFISETVSRFSRDEYLKVVDNIDLISKDKALKLTDEVTKIANTCLNSRLSVMSWIDFKSKAQNGSLEEYLLSCRQRVETFAVTNIANNEIKAQVKDLVEVGAINLADSKKIIAKITNELGGSENLKEAIKIGFKNAGHDTDLYMKEITEKATKIITENIHKNVFANILKDLSEINGIEPFMNKAKLLFTPACLAKLQEDEIEEVSEDGDSYKEIISMVTKAIKRSIKIGNHNKVIKKLGVFCRDKKTKGLSSAMKAGYFDLLLKSEAEDTFWSEFKKKVLDDEMKDIPLHKRTKFDKYYVKNMNIMFDIFENNPKAFETIMDNNPGIIKYLRNNYQNKDDPTVSRSLEVQLASGFLSDKQENSPASFLMKLILIRNIGNEGKQEALEAVNKEVSNLPGVKKLVKKKLLKAGSDQVNKYWKPGALAQILKWENLSDSERIQVQLYLLNNMIVSKNKDKLSNQIKSFLDQKIEYDNASFSDRFGEVVSKKMAQDGLF